MTDQDQQRGRMARAESRRLRAVVIAHLARMQRREDDAGQFRAKDFEPFGVHRIHMMRPTINQLGKFLNWSVILQRDWPANER